MERKKMPAGLAGKNTFIVQIQHTQNATWQGTIDQAGGEQQRFRSALEMLKIIDSALEAKDPDEQEKKMRKIG